MHPPNGTWLVCLQVENVGSIRESMPLLKTHLKTTTIGVTNINDAARRNSQDGVSELSVTGTQFDQQSHIHHVATGVKERHTMLAGGSEQIYNPHHMMTEPSNETHHTQY